MFLLKLHLLSIILICYPAFFNIRINCANIDGNKFVDISGLETIVTENSMQRKLNNDSLAATELDILMPPIELTESYLDLTGIAKSNLNANEQVKNSGNEASNWWHTYDALLLALGMVVMLLLMVLFTHCIWRRHLERRACDWEAENERLYCSTPYYMDRNQILVY